MLPVKEIPIPVWGENIQNCRSCGSTKLQVFLRLGDLPLSGHLLTEADLGAAEVRYPLDVAFCWECFLVQILYTVPPAAVFQTAYPYFSSVSPTWVAHCKANVDMLVQRFGPGPLGLVVELASNDGYLLQHFKPHGVPVLGIDPAEGPAAAARAKGIPTVNEFFTSELAEKLVSDGHRADIVIGNNVLAHVADLNGFVSGVRTLLKDDGVAVFEVPHVVELIERGAFDTIYHEHLCYFSLTALCWLFHRHGLEVFDVEQLPTHGGSLRVYVRKGGGCYAQGTPLRLLQQERERWVTTFGHYAGFAARVEKVRDDLLAFLAEQSSLAKRVVAYGAAAKGGTLLNYCGIRADLLGYVVDRSPAKQGRWMTGSRLPIYSPENLLEDQPDYALLLVWNFRDEVLAQQAEYRRRGGRFVLPIPELEVL